MHAPRRANPSQNQHRSLRQHIHVTEAILRHVEHGDFFRQLDCEFDIVADSSVAKSGACRAAPTPLTAAAIPFIEELICRQTPLVRPLRLMCLLSACAGGLDDALLASLRRAFLHAYGHEHLLTLRRLEALGLLTSRTATSQRTGLSFSQLRERHRLVRHGDAAEARFAHYYGFAPLSAALVEAARVPAGATLLVVMLGGVASGELAALREMARRTGVSLHVAATAVVSGAELLESLLATRQV